MDEPYEADEATLRYMTAKGYLLACKMITRSQHYSSHQTAVILPLHLLGGFALELYLKAWLLKAGLSSAQVKTYGHTIRSLYEYATAKGLPNIPRLIELRDHLASPHADFTFRYIMPGESMTDTHWDMAFNVFDELDRVVDLYVGASAGMALQQVH